METSAFLLANLCFFMLFKWLEIFCYGAIINFLHIPLSSMDGLITDVEPCLLLDPHSQHCLTQDISLVTCNFSTGNFFDDFSLVIVLDEGDVGLERVFFVFLNWLLDAILEKVLGCPCVDEDWLDG